MNASTGLSARAWNGVNIARRDADGYVNATAMCRANAKRWRDYSINDRSQAYIAALAAEARIPASALVHSIRGGKPEHQGTWIHPRLAVDLARWISPAFAVWMDAWFLESIQQSSVIGMFLDMDARLLRMDELYGNLRVLVGQQATHSTNLQSAPYYRYLLMECCMNLMIEAHGEVSGMFAAGLPVSANPR